MQRAVGSAVGRLSGAPASVPAPAPSTVNGPQRTVEREALKLALQYPVLAGPMFDDAAVVSQTAFPI